MSDPIGNKGGPGKTATDARQGTKLGVMRYVLGISVVLAIIAMVLAFKYS